MNRGTILGGCQNYGPLLGTLNTRCRIIKGIQKGTIILTITHIDSLLFVEATVLPPTVNHMWQGSYFVVFVYKLYIVTYPISGSHGPYMALIEVTLVS